MSTFKAESKIDFACLLLTRQSTRGAVNTYTVVVNATVKRSALKQFFYFFFYYYYYFFFIFSVYIDCWQTTNLTLLSVTGKQCG